MNVTHLSNSSYTTEVGGFSSVDAFIAISVVDYFYYVTDVTGFYAVVTNEYVSAAVDFYSVVDVVPFADVTDFDVK